MDLGDRFSTRKKYLIDINNYKVLQKIKTGGFGTVYMIKDKTTQTKYAAKIINGDADDEQSKKMINREIGILMRLQHPTIVEFIGYSLQDPKGNDNVTLIMTLAEKGSLASILQDVQHGLAEPIYDNTIRQKILIGIARGMMYLHKNHVIHRDLKPGNILIDNNYHPLITDFGLSKIYSLDQSHKQTEACGTSIYMAPEIIRGSSYNGKADVYSFGIMMYEIITDTTPYPLFESKKLSLFEFNNKVVKEHYRPKFTTPIKNSLKKLIEECWSDDPKLRPTFNEIFNKLAFNMEENVYDIFEDDEEFKFYLDGVDADEVLSYAYEISDDISEKGSDISEMKDQINKQKVLINSLKSDNDELKRENKENRDEIMSLRSIVEEQKKTIDFLNKENSNQKKINSDVMRRIDLIENKAKSDDHAYASPSLPKSDDSDKIIKKKKSPHYHSSDQIITFNKKDSFEGIIKYLTEKTGGNIHENGTIEVTSNSIDQHPKNLLNDDNYVDYMAERGCKDFWVCFDFKNMEVEISGYIIKSYSYKAGHLRSWILEISNDGKNWTPIDEHLNCDKLNGGHNTGSFDAKPNNFCRFCRICHKGEYWGYKSSIYPGFNQIDFFGRLKIPIHK